MTVKHPSAEQPQPAQEVEASPGTKPQDQPQPRLSDLERGLLAGILIGEGHFGGDGRRPQISLEEALSDEVDAHVAGRIREMRRRYADFFARYER
jgi:hypothetical protein